MHDFNKHLFILLLFCVAAACQQKEKTLFRLVSPSDSGVYFNNEIKETDQINILKLEYLYNGGGVGVGDFNNDGLKDLFFSANIVDNKLYINKGNLQFDDISEKAGILGRGRWKSSVAVVDINNDGWQDIFVCATISSDSVERTDLLFVNQGLSADGTPTFKEEAAKYGLADPDYNSNAAFFDYDNDGDLDLYLLINSKQVVVPVVYRFRVNDGTSSLTDKLYRNNGDGTFTNVSKDAGILCEGYGLGLGIFDANGDGWQDVYVSNDYLTNDLLYINRNGHFRNDIDSLIKHQAKFSMGNDIADINNDGYPDIINLDMLPETNIRKKTVIGDNGYITFVNDKRYGYAHQYVRNMLQLNNGDGTFKEIGRLAGIHQTEWSWSPLLADFDNDGHRDLMVTNGFPKDISDLDFVTYRTSVGSLANPKLMLGDIPEVKVSNYAYKNNGDLTFEDVTTKWGIRKPSFSNGAAFVDLDNDGDLDYVVNNINDPAFIYENTLYEKGQKTPAENHYFRIKLEGAKTNPQGLGTKIWIWAGGKLQYHEQSVYRGYISTVDDVVHFGLGALTQIDSLRVLWPGGKQHFVQNIPADQVMTLRIADAQEMSLPAKPIQVALMEEQTKALGINYVHPIYDIIDYNLQRTLPHKFSQNNPGVAVGDVNGDGLDDFCTGSFAKDTVALFLQQSNGRFSKKVIQSGIDKPYSDTGLLLFDADADADLDLLVVSGGFQFPRGSEYYNDRLYRNDGKGNFKQDTLALPRDASAGSCARAADFDADGDLDLFVGGMVDFKSWPLPARSAFLINDGGKFSDATATVCADIDSVGIVMDAIWTDYDSDGRPDLMVVGEFMTIRVFHNEGNKLVPALQTGLENYAGWWNSITGGDFDNDGDMDYVAGNLGANNHYQVTENLPMKVFAADFDQNHDLDAIIFCPFLTDDGTRKHCPVHYWDDLNKQSPKFRRRFKSYKDYGSATLDSILTPDEQKSAYTREANYFRSVYIENLSNGKFKISPLPFDAQVSPVKGMTPFDINGDGNLDLVLVGNEFSNEVFSGQYDALDGLILLGNGKGGFNAVSKSQSGFRVEGDAKSLCRLAAKKGDLFIASQTRGPLRVFAPLQAPAGKRITPGPLDVTATLVYADGRKQVSELYYGSGFLSQSTRTFIVPSGVTSVILKDSKGKSRAVSKF